MADKKIEDFAHKHNCSNAEAKRRLKTGKHRGSEIGDMAPKRGVVVAGTGKPKGE